MNKIISYNFLETHENYHNFLDLKDKDNYVVIDKKDFKLTINYLYFEKIEEIKIEDVINIDDEHILIEKDKYFKLINVLLKNKINANKIINYSPFK